MRKSFRRILIKRVFNAFITIILIMSLNFVLFRMVPVDPAAIMIEKDPQTTAAAYWRNVELMGLNDSLWDQFVSYFIMTFSGDWGESYSFERPVFEVTKAAIYWTMLLIGVSTALTFIIGMILGKIAALRRGKATDLTITGFGIFFYGMPVFWFAIILLIIFSGQLAWLPSGHRMEPGTTVFPISLEKIVDIIEHMILPAATMTIGAIAGVVLIMRNSLIDVLTEDYIVTSYAKGLSERQTMKRHASPNARLPIVTTLAMDMAFIFGGAFQVEVVFSYQGIGLVTMNAIWNMDYPMLQFIFLIGGVAVVLANLVADLILVKLDPRIQIV
ncbi:MAG: ABC transporter permease [Methanobacteriota archaeon]|nr:MAG: ABC transporter permease [Euryarchaeota archaeon]